MGSFHDLRQTAGLTRAAVATLLAVTPRTVDRWERRDAPKSALYVLEWAATGVPVTAPGFAGWRFDRDGALCAPEGDVYRPEDLRALHWFRQLAAARGAPVPHQLDLI